MRSAVLLRDPREGLFKKVRVRKKEYIYTDKCVFNIFVFCLAWVVFINFEFLKCSLKYYLS